MADIFISYSSKDREKAEELSQVLASAGLSVWIDKQGIGAATSWTREIAEALDACRVFVLLLSNNSLASKNVIKELSLAAEAEKHIIPIELEPITIPTTFRYHLAGLQRTPYENTNGIIEALDRMGVRATAPEASSTNNPVDIHSDLICLAVLPFEDLSPTHDNEWFADGMMDELIGTLGSIEKLQVAPRSDVIYYKKSRPKPAEIAAELKIRYIIDGSVQKSGDKIRLHISLADTKEHKQLWNGKYDGTFEDIFDFQDQTAIAITDALRLILSPQEEEKIEKKETENADAYELYLKGLSYQDRHTKTDYEYALKQFRTAIELDPQFVAAHLEIANTSYAYFRRHSRDPKWLDTAEDHLAKAKAIEGKTARVLTIESLISIGRGKTEEAVQMAEQATQLDADYAPAFFSLVTAYQTHGKIAESITAAEKYLALRPDDRNASINYLSILYIADKNKAEQFGRKLIPLLERHTRLMPDDLNARVQFAMVLGISEERDRAFAEAEYVGANWEKADGIALLSLASFHQVFGTSEHVIPMLHKCIDRGYRNIDMLRSSKVLTPLHGTAEFEAVVSRLEQTIEEENLSHR
ncbi:MAG TPA: TIR domain-containing protein [Candidatus Kapabacteria bacterium]|nr:TIR domain-containing protein [Candidatus Kapabacteria bacterium]